MRWALLETALKSHRQKGDGISLNKRGCQFNSSMRACSFQNRKAQSLQVFEASWGELADHGLWPRTHRITWGASNYVERFSCHSQVCLWQGDSITGIWGGSSGPQRGSCWAEGVSRREVAFCPPKQNESVPLLVFSKKAANEWTLPALLGRPNYIIRVDPSGQKICVTERYSFWVGVEMRISII